MNPREERKVCSLSFTVHRDDYEELMDPRPEDDKEYTPARVTHDDQASLIRGATGFTVLLVLESRRK